MFSGFKSFIDGWNAQGSTPGVSPEIPYAYVRGIETFLDDKKAWTECRQLLRTAKVPKILFNFSLETLAISMALAMISIRGQDIPGYRQAGKAAIDNLIKSIASKRPPVKVSQVVISNQELLELLNQYSNPTSSLTVSELNEMRLAHAGLLKGISSLRSACIADSIGLAVMKGGAQGDVFTGLSRAISRQFLAYMNIYNPKIQQEIQFASHVIKLFYNFKDIP